MLSPRRSSLLLLLLVSSLAACGSKKKPVETTDPVAADPEPHYRRGNDHLNKGRPDLAARELETAVALAPDNAIYQYSLALAYLGRKDYARAEPTLRRTLDIDPYFSDARVVLSIIYSEQERYDEALREVDAVLDDRRYLTREVALFNKGRILFAKGKPMEAEIFVRQAIMKKPDRVDWLVAHGAILEELGQLDEAIDQYEKAVKQSPSNQDAWFRLGEVLLRRGRREDAHEKFLKAFELEPTSPTGQRAKDRLRELR